MFNVIVKDIKGTNYNFTCDYFTESFDGDLNRQSLILYKDNNVDSNFIESFAALHDMEIATITMIIDGNDEEVISYNNYKRLGNAAVTCRTSLNIEETTPSKNPIFQGTATFCK